VTLAVGHSRSTGEDVLDIPAGTRIYLPDVRRYFIVEDTCGDGPKPEEGPCHTGAAKFGNASLWIDMLIGGKDESGSFVRNCARKATGITTAIFNPQDHYPVASGQGVIHDGKCDAGYGAGVAGKKTGKPGCAAPAKLETMSSLKTKPAKSTSVKAVLAAAAVDILLILAFAAIGRDAHHREEPVLGVLQTAWPFLAGAAAGWVASRAWRAPLSLVRAGVPVWLGSLVGGMLLRALTAQTVVLPFIIVATLALAVFLLGYRLLVAGFGRLRKK